ncbi:MAG: ATP-binding cassette domain-containing protein [Elusimicrobia bacterium]|nr:ATP-binding cassette domain-containing protein [Elusimicrobiota bacterium]
MYEIILNGILHFFAIFSALNPEKRALARKVVEGYLRKHLGLSKPEVYLELFDGLFDLYAGVRGSGLREKNIKDLCGTLGARLSRPEQYLVMLGAIELVRILEADGAPSRALMSLAARSFAMPAAVLENIFRLVFAPGGLERLNGEFLLVSAPAPGAPAPGAPACRRLTKAHFQARLVVLRIRETGSFFMSALSDGVTLDDNPVPPRSVRALAPGSLIRDAYSNVVYSAEIEGAFSDLPAQGAPILFQGTDLNYRFPRSDMGLHDFSFTARSGSLIGVMGGSGTGKSTLLSILSGTLPPDSGSVTVNGIDLYREPERLQGVIGYVPQDDLLFNDLTVRQNLHFSAQLCLAHLGAQELGDRVDQTLVQLHAQEISGLKVGSPTDKIISGGQRKRLNIALELIRGPEILFLDEPTSGLSSTDSENVMSLLRSQAAMGKLVIVIIHQPSSNIFKMFDGLWILDQGGYPIYAGNPVEAVRYFRAAIDLAGAEQSGCPNCGNVSPGQLFSIIETKRLDAAGRFTRERRYSPRFWHDLYLRQERSRPRPAAPKSLPAPAPSLHKPGLWGQMGIFLKRNVLAKLANRQYLAINLLEAPLLALIVAGITRLSHYGAYSFGAGKYLAIFYFMSVIVALFLGLSVSAEEIVRDRTVIKRERFLHLSWLSYWSSKGLYLAGLCGVQMLSYVLVSVALLAIPDMSGKMFAVLFSCAAFACVLGLNLSASFKTAVTIYILIPLLLIPQILLCGLVIRFDDLKSADAENNYVPLVGELLASRWGLEALVTEQYLANRYQSRLDEFDRELSRCGYVADDLVPEIQAKLDFLFLKTELPDKEKTRARYAALVRNEVRRLEGRTGLRLGWPDERFSAERITRPLAEELRVFLRKVAAWCNERKAAAAERRRQAAAELLKEYGERGWSELKTRHHNTSIADLVRNRQELDPLRLSGERLVQLSDPIYQPAESPWGRAVFLASEKRLSGLVLGAYAFDLLAIWAMTALLVLALHLKLLKRILDGSGG